MGIETYNKHCRGIVTRYSKEWERTIKRLGRWIDFENDYKTMVSERGIKPCFCVSVLPAVPTCFSLLFLIASNIWSTHAHPWT